MWSNLTKTYAWLVQNKDYETGEDSWPYLEAMSFLKPFVKDYNLCDVINGEKLINYEASVEAGIPVPVFSNEKSSFCGENNPFILDNPVKPEGDLTEDPIVDQISQSALRTPSPSLSTNCVAKKSLEVEDALCQYLKKKITKQKDPNELFLISVAHDMKMLSPQDQAVFKMKVQQLLVEMISKSNPSI
ncbi:hypothetical protein J437_LFUL010956 [Ladona fulva]|uniref:BESS domain-containing protein n=1 Tax=Ladona fulva TaxID=123851 RepID=A0A8K0P7Z6_LADFU|nr:hypothetical protein J437_LFUL010956 [Ladona fulva]